MRRFLRHRPLYSACNEDSRSELRALDPMSDDIVIAICSGGGRVLSLLTSPAGRVVAVDRRPDQLFQLELKAAAVDALGYDEFSSFIGLTPGRDRRDVYSAIRPALGSDAQAYWDGRLDLVDEGVLYAGRCERALTRYSALLQRAGFLGWAGRCFHARDLVEQAEILDEHRDRIARDEIYWRLYCQKLFVFAATQDPGFLRSTHRSVGRFIHRRFIEYLREHLFRESFFLHLLYFGCYAPAGSLPLYLTLSGFDRVKKNLARLELSCSTMEGFVDRWRPHGRVKWSLSDVSGWMSERRFRELIRAISQTGSPGSRFCARNFVAERTLPGGPATSVRRLDDLCRELGRDDASVVWSFEIGEYGSPAPRI